MQTNAILTKVRAIAKQQPDKKASLLWPLLSFFQSSRGGKHQLKSRVVFLLFFLAGSTTEAQPPTIAWQKSLGGSYDDVATSIQPTSDGGYIVAGESSSNDGDVSGNHGSSDYWIVKLDGTGNLLWQKSLGGSGSDGASSIQQTADGGYIVAGESSSNDGDVSGNHGSHDYWIVKLDGTGNLLWQKSLGGSGSDGASSIQQTADGGYIVAGFSYSNDGDVSDHYGSVFTADYWVVKLDGSGNLLWQKSLGGSDNDVAYAIQQTADGGYIVAGFSPSNDGDVSGNHGFYDYWIVKLDGTGHPLWQKSLGGSSHDIAYSIQPTSDGGYIVAGSSSSNDGDVSGNHSSDDYWVVKLDGTGNLLWQKSLGGSSHDIAYSIQPTSDGGYIVAGFSSSNDGDVSGHHGFTDFWIVKLDGSGNLLWQKSLGGSDDDVAYAIQQTADGGYIVAGYSYSTDGDVSGHHGNVDYWVVKFGTAPITTYYLDADNDGYGNRNSSIITSSPPEGYVSDNTDCDDRYASIHPGAQEVCDGLDNNCNGKIDDLSLSISGFTLVNADTDQDILSLTEGAVLDLSKLPKAPLTIRANPSPEKVGSVVFSLSGALSYRHTEDGAPYALFGGKGRDVRGGALPPGEYTLTATPYCRDKGQGTKGSPLTIHFQVVYGAAVTRFTLVNAQTGKDIRELEEGAVLELSTLPTKELSIRAYTTPDTVGSVLFSLSGGQPHQQTENQLPYALFGGSRGSYTLWTPQSGTYLLSAVPHSAPGGRGTRGTALSRHFSVIKDLQQPCTTPGFEPVTTYPSGGASAYSITQGDFNRDGYPDIAVAQGVSIGVQLGEGSGGFQPAVTYPSGGENINALTAGDFNGDGKLDLAATLEDAETTAGSLGVLLGKGDGSFALPIPSPSSTGGATSLVAGDFNGDGKLDAVYARGDLVGIGVMLGKGDGRFSEAVEYDSVSNETYGLTTGEFNGDGKLDLAAANYSGDVGMFLGKGDGGFHAVVNYPSTDPFGDATISITAGDFNQDGNLDVAVVNTLSLGVLLGKGDGSLAEVDLYPVDNGLSYLIHTNDFNGDGVLDLVIRTAMLLGKGDGRFSFTEGLSGTGNANSIVSGDYNGDNKQDMAIANFGGTIGVLLNSCEAASLPTVSKMIEKPLLFSENKAAGLVASPNPFSSQTTIRFSVEKTGYTSLVVYNATGVEVRRLYQGKAVEGREYQANLNAGSLMAGVYALRLATPDGAITYKVVLVR